MKHKTLTNPITH